MNAEPTMRVDIQVHYDDSEFPDCRGWRAFMGEMEISGTRLTGAGHPTISAAVAAVEKWAHDRNIDLSMSVLEISGKPKEATA